MSEILEMQKLRVRVLNEIIKLKNPNNTGFNGDISYINGKINAYKHILEEIDKSIEKLFE